MKTSPEINELAAALAAAQAKFPTVERTETAQIRNEKANYQYRYASLASVLEAVRAPLADNGLAIIQSPKTGESGRIVIHLLLLHKSGQFMEDEFSLPVAQQTPQGIGSIISYARRYQLQAFLGLGTDDDDAQEAQTTQPRSERRSSNATERAPRPPKAEEPDGLSPSTPEQQKAIANICDKNNWDADVTAQKWYEIAVSELTYNQAREMIAKLNKMVSQVGANN